MTGGLINSRQNFWFDTEFLDDGKTVELISIGMVSEDGRKYYAENVECDLTRGCPWVQANVVPHLPGPKFPRAKIAKDLIEFCGHRPQFWGYYSAYDWLVLCQLFGRMLDVPASWPNLCFDIQQLRVMLGVIDLPAQSSAKHNALNDAEWTKAAWEYLMLHLRK